MSDEQFEQPYARLEEKNNNFSIELVNLGTKKEPKGKPTEVVELFGHMLSFLSSEELANIRSLSKPANKEAKHILSSRRSNEIKLKELLHGKKEFVEGSHEEKWKSERYSAFYSNFYANVRSLFNKAAKQSMKMFFVLLCGTFFVGCFVVLGLADANTSPSPIPISSHFLSLGKFILNEAILILCASLFIGIIAFIILKKGNSYNSIIHSLDRLKKYLAPIIFLVNVAFAAFFYTLSSTPLDITYFVGLILVNLFSSSLVCFEMLQNIRCHLHIFWWGKLKAIKNEFFKVCDHLINNADKNNSDKISNDFLVKIALNLRESLDATGEQKRETLFGIEKMIAKRELEKIFGEEEKMVAQPDRAEKFVRVIMNMYDDNAKKISDQAAQNFYIPFHEEEKQEKKLIDRIDIYILTDDQRKFLIAQINLDTMIAELDEQIRGIMSNFSNQKLSEIRQKWDQLMTFIEVNKNIPIINEMVTVIFENLITHAKTNTDSMAIDVRGIIIFEKLMNYVEVNGNLLTVRQKGTLVFEMLRFATKIRNMPYLMPGPIIEQIKTWITLVKKQRAEIELNEMLAELNRTSEITATDFLTSAQREDVIAAIQRDYKDAITWVVDRVENVNSAQDLTPEQKNERTAALIDSTVALMPEQKGTMIAKLKRIMEMNRTEISADAKEEKSELPPPVHNYLSSSSSTLFAGAPPSVPVVGATSEAFTF